MRSAILPPIWAGLTPLMIARTLIVSSEIIDFRFRLDCRCGYWRKCHAAVLQELNLQAHYCLWPLIRRSEMLVVILGYLARHINMTMKDLQCRKPKLFYSDLAPKAPPSAFKIGKILQIDSNMIESEWDEQGLNNFYAIICNKNEKRRFNRLEELLPGQCR